MNLLRGQIGRRVLARSEAVHGFTLRQLPDAFPIPRRRQVIFDKKLLQLAKGRNNRCYDFIFRRQRESRAVRLRDRSMKMGEWFVERACFRVVDDLMVELCRNTSEDNLRKNHPCLYTLP